MRSSIILLETECSVLQPNLLQQIATPSSTAIESRNFQQDNDRLFPAINLSILPWPAKCLELSLNEHLTINLKRALTHY